MEANLGPQKEGAAKACEAVKGADKEPAGHERLKKQKNKIERLFWA